MSEKQTRILPNKLWELSSICGGILYLKIPKSLDTRRICCNHPKIFTRYRKRCRQNGKQCRPWSDLFSRSSLIWGYTVCPDLSVPKLRTIMVLLEGKTSFSAIKFVSMALGFEPLAFNNRRILIIFLQKLYISHQNNEHIPSSNQDWVRPKVWGQSSWLKWS